MPPAPRPSLRHTEASGGGDTSIPHMVVAIPQGLILILEAAEVALPDEEKGGDG